MNFARNEIFIIFNHFFHLEFKNLIGYSSLKTNYMEDSKIITKVNTL